MVLLKYPCFKEGLEVITCASDVSLGKHPIFCKQAGQEDVACIRSGLNSMCTSIDLLPLRSFWAANGGMQNDMSSIWNYCGERTVTELSPGPGLCRQKQMILSPFSEQMTVKEYMPKFQFQKQPQILFSSHSKLWARISPRSPRFFIGSL